MRALLTLVWVVCCFASIGAMLVMLFTLLDFNANRFCAALFSFGAFMVPVIWLRDDVE